MALPPESPPRRRLSQKTITSDGTTATIQIPFPSLAPEDLHAASDQTPVPIAYRPTPESATVAPVPAAGKPLTFYRRTPIAEPHAVFTDPGQISAQTLNASIAQLLYSIQELWAEVEGLAAQTAANTLRLEDLATRLTTLATRLDACDCATPPPTAPDPTIGPGPVLTATAAPNHFDGVADTTSGPAVASTTVTITAAGGTAPYTLVLKDPGPFSVVPYTFGPDNGTTCPVSISSQHSQGSTDTVTGTIHLHVLDSSTPQQAYEIAVTGSQSAHNTTGTQPTNPPPAPPPDPQPQPQPTPPDPLTATPANTSNTGVTNSSSQPAVARATFTVSGGVPPYHLDSIGYPQTGQQADYPSSAQPLSGTQWQVSVSHTLQPGQTGGISVYPRFMDSAGTAVFANFDAEFQTTEQPPPALVFNVAGSNPTDTQTMNIPAAST